MVRCPAPEEEACTENHVPECQNKEYDKVNNRYFHPE